MKRKTFQQFLLEVNQATPNKEWRKSFFQLNKGFVPPSKMKPVVEAFLKSGEIQLTHDTGKAPTMPKKSLFLVGGPVRDFLKGKTVKDYDLATNATPEQTAHILSNFGFKMAGDRSGKKGQPLNINFHVEEAGPHDKKYWFIKGRDASKEQKPFVISAVVDGEEFEIATFRKDSKVTDGAAEVDFADNPTEDAERRDLTINSLYIELTKSSGENKKLYDPTGKGLYDIENNIVRTVGKAEDRFNEDKLRVLRAIRFHSRFGSGENLDPDIEKAIPKFAELRGVALERIRDEFLKGLLHPDVDVKRYVKIYKRTGMLHKVFPNLNFDPPVGIPEQFTDKKDKPLALAWLLQHNTPEEVDHALRPTRTVDGEEKQTGWTVDERKAVVFLLRLREFDPQNIPALLRMKQISGLSPQQIRDWVDMFGNKHGHPRPIWKKMVNQFAGYAPKARWDNLQNTEKDVCRNCNGSGCRECGGKGRLPPHHRKDVLGQEEIKHFLDELD